MSDQKPDKQMRICVVCKLGFIGMKNDNYCPDCYKKACSQADSINNFYKRGGSHVD